MILALPALMLVELLAALRNDDAGAYPYLLLTAQRT